MRGRSLGPLASLLPSLARSARTAGGEPYLVGGAVRDLLLERTPVDVDVAFEGPASGVTELITALAAEEGWSVEARHERFGTATMKSPDGQRVDLAATRKESYPYPGALPVVRTGVPILVDLGRRDFTVHAMAFHLSDNGIDRSMLDPFEGKADLDRRVVRLLHEGSLSDDPTRFFRAARYAARLGFDLDPGFGRAVRHAFDSGTFSRISGDRLRRALHEVLTEENRAMAVAILGRLGAFNGVAEGWAVSASVADDLSGASNAGEAWARLLTPLSGEVRKRIADRLSFSRALRRITGCSR